MLFFLKKFNLKNYLSVTISVLVSLFFVTMTVYGATTVNNSINTGGTLTVSGASTLTGAVSIAGALMASSTLQVSNAVVLYDTVSFRTGIGASSTLQVAGISMLGTTTVSTATASSTPAQELSVLGDAYIGGGPGTTTLVIDGGSGSAGCIQLRAADGTMVRLYASSTVPATSGTNARTNGTQLVVEAGACK